MHNLDEERRLDEEWHTNLDNLIEWGKHWRDLELARIESDVSDKIATRIIEDKYAAYIKDPDRLPAETVKKYSEICRLFFSCCEEFGFTKMPPKPGVVAFFLGVMLHDGASHAELKEAVDGISYMVRLNEHFDVTEHKFVKAVLSASQGERPSSEPKNREDN